MGSKLMMGGDRLQLDWVELNLRGMHCDIHLGGW
jgi:hypothetical protein